MATRANLITLAEAYVPRLSVDATNWHKWLDMGMARVWRFRRGASAEAAKGTYTTTATTKEYTWTTVSATIDITAVTAIYLGDETVPLRRLSDRERDERGYYFWDGKIIFTFDPDGKALTLYGRIARPSMTNGGDDTDSLLTELGDEAVAAYAAYCATIANPPRDDALLLQHKQALVEFAREQEEGQGFQAMPPGVLQW